MCSKLGGFLDQISDLFAIAYFPPSKLREMLDSSLIPDLIHCVSVCVSKMVRYVHR